MENKNRKQLYKLIQRCENELRNIQTLPYYQVFNRRAEQLADILELENKITGLKSQLNA